MLNSTALVHSPLCGNVSCVGIVFRLEQPEVSPNPTKINVGLPPGPVLGDTEEARPAAVSPAPPILLVNATCDIPEITKPVVVDDPVNVVYYPTWPLPVHVKPRKPRCVVWGEVHFDGPPAVGVYAPSEPAFTNISPRSLPCKVPGVRVIFKDLAESVCGKISLSHAVVPYKQWFGQKPRSVSSTSGLRHFTARIDRSKHGLSTLDTGWPGVSVSVPSTLGAAEHTPDQPTKGDPYRDDAARRCGPGISRAASPESIACP